MGRRTSRAVAAALLIAAGGTTAAPVNLGHLSKQGETLVAASSESPFPSEARLAQWLIELRAVVPDARLREQVRALTRYRSKALGPAPEPHPAKDALAPMFDIASQARGTLRAWEVADRVIVARGALASGNPAALPMADGEALALAMTDAPRAQLVALDAARLPARAAIVHARRLGDAQLYDALLQRPVDPFVLQALREIPDALPASDAMRVLTRAAGRLELASAATLAMEPLQPALAELIACLGDTHRGGSCAQLLAQRQDAASIEALRSLAGAGRDDLATRRALLALWWNRSPGGWDALRSYAGDARMPQALRQMVSQWLH